MAVHTDPRDVTILAAEPACHEQRRRLRRCVVRALDHADPAERRAGLSLSVMSSDDTSFDRQQQGAGDGHRNNAVAIAARYDLARLGRPGAIPSDGAACQGDALG